MALVTSGNTCEAARPLATPRAARSSHSLAHYHYIDFSRAVLLSLGVVFHAALLCETRGAAFCGLAALLHSFRMESFFLIAGFFSAMALQKRSVADFVAQRLVRLGVPLLFCGVTVAWWVDIVRANELPLATAFDVHFWLGGHWRAHLWFLGTLLVYVAIVFAIHTLAPNVDRLVRRHRIPLGGFVAVVALTYFVTIHLCKLAPDVFGAIAGSS